MKTANPFAVVLVTAPDLKTARTLARVALEAKLVACANLVPQIESHYWWQGRRERAREVLLILKTTRACWPELEACIRHHHPYDTPEILALPIDRGPERYLAWVAASCTAGNWLRRQRRKQTVGGSRR